MKLTLISLLLLCTYLASAQIVIEGKDINQDSTIRICEVIVSEKGFSNKVYINIDYGQETKWVSGKGTLVTDENKKVIDFNSTVHALNFFENNGWTLIGSYIVTINGLNKYHYLFRKRI